MRITTSLLVTLMALTWPAAQARAENLDLLMSQVFEPGTADYIGYESIEREDIPESAAVERKYLIVDFRFTEKQPTGQQLQASIHEVCTALLKNRELIRSLSDSGYDMVSVAFDRRSQFDCL
ncbi:hypothetical protein [Marinobacter persicus]|uniref:Uncharacterized protein n=1 Tax=Marinobacter persicus TaxID=930118 RepID=A0A2S6G6N0_9GAMM|nr:hypothetical protein [Marinobacter persicus]PPK51416.1 hypothetical protein BY455_11215 [Marinobacter persicus]PPK54804.1 hypothetical protein B0H24_101071 [Marinobacter persicus]PPK58103.1 hypothetical protein BY454_11215 [Marinobacter persicus]